MASYSRFIIAVLVFVLSSIALSAQNNSDIEILLYLRDSGFWDTAQPGYKIDLVEGIISEPSSNEVEDFRSAAKHSTLQIIRQYNEAILQTNAAKDYLYAFHTNIINQYQTTLKTLGDDKYKHFAVSVGLVNLAYFGNNDNWYSMVRAKRAVFRKGLVKELNDKAIDKKSLDRIMGGYDAITKMELEYIEKLQELNLDQEDLSADMIGIDVGSSLLNLNYLGFREY